MLNHPGKIVFHQKILPMFLIWLLSLSLQNIAIAEKGQYQHYSAVLPAFGSLCNGGPVPCNRIDSPLAADLRLDILPFTNNKEKHTGIFLPLWLSVPLFGRVEGGIGFVYSQWHDSRNQAQASIGPVLLSAKALVWPLFSNPISRSSVAVHLQYEQPVGPFSGINSLGGHGSLGAARISYSYPWKFVELGLSLGAQFDWRGEYGEGEAGVRVSVKVPPLSKDEFSIFAEGIARSLAWGNIAPPLGSLTLGVNSRTEAGLENALFFQVTQSPDTTQFMLGLRLASIHFGPQYKSVEIISNLIKKISEYRKSRKQAASQRTQKPSDPTAVSDECVLYDSHGIARYGFGHLDPTGQYCQSNGKILPVGVPITTIDSSIETIEKEFQTQKDTEIYRVHNKGIRRRKHSHEKVQLLASTKRHLETEFLHGLTGSTLSLRGALGARGAKQYIPNVCVLPGLDFPVHVGPKPNNTESKGTLDKVKDTIVNKVLPSITPSWQTFKTNVKEYFDVVQTIAPPVIVAGTVIAIGAEALKDAIVADATAAGMGAILEHTTSTALARVSSSASSLQPVFTHFLDNIPSQLAPSGMLGGIPGPLVPLKGLIDLPTVLEPLGQQVSHSDNVQDGRQEQLPGLSPDSNKEESSSEGDQTQTAETTPNRGRANRQKRLRELAEDPNTSSSDKGWIKQDINEIETGKRTNIRNPPGKELAHQRGREAAKGYDYRYSDLQDADLHKTQHKHDDFGRKNKERPDNDDDK